MKTVNDAIVGHKNMHITYLHPSVLATRSIVFICNSFSNVLADAHTFRVPTIEYSNNNADPGIDESLFPSGFSIEPQYVDYFIDNNAEVFLQVLGEILSSDFYPSTFDGAPDGDDDLFISLAS
jgi:hypothetical protein